MEKVRDSMRSKVLHSGTVAKSNPKFFKKNLTVSNSFIGAVNNGYGN